MYNDIKDGNFNDISAKFRTNFDTTENAKSNIIREIIHRYRAEGIEFAFPSMSLYNGDFNVKIG